MPREKPHHVDADFSLPSPTATTARSSRTNGVGLAWVQENGNRHRVSEYASLAPSARPDVSCPVCHDRVTLKLGARVTHHAAHRPGVDCAATNPETALHLNVKLHLAEELKNAQALVVRQNCSNRTRRGCAEVREFELARGWTDVRVEMTVGSRRPDITFLYEREAFAAIEVAVTHLVDAEKSIDLERQGLRWIEVTAVPELYAQGDSWTANDALAASRVGATDAWECPSCTRDRREAEFAARNGPHIRHQRVVDYYYPSGKMWREIYETVTELVDGKVVAILLETKASTVFRVEGPDTADSWLALKQAFRFHVEQHAARCHARVECATSWQSVGHTDAAMYQACQLALVPFRFKWSTRYQRWFETKEWRASRGGPASLPR